MIRYELKHGDMLTLGDVTCQYLVDLDDEEVSKALRYFIFITAHFLCCFCPFRGFTCRCIYIYTLVIG